MHAVILAGGRGVRLHPHATALPKPLVPIGGRFTVLEVLLAQLAGQGFRSVTVTVGPLGHLVRSCVGDGYRWGIDVDYAQESAPLGTIGSVVRIVDRLPEQVMVVNGDTLTELSYADLMVTHLRNPAPLTVATCRREVEIDYGVMDVVGDRIVAFREKPRLGQRVSMGAYALSTAELRAYDPARPLGFDAFVVDLLARGLQPASFLFQGLWYDLGRQQDYERAEREFRRYEARLLPDGMPDNGSWTTSAHIA